MDDTNDNPSYSNSSQSPIFQPNQINKIIEICYEGSTFVGFIISVIQIFMLGSFGNSSNTLFLISVLVYHSLAILKNIFPKFKIEADLQNKLFLSADVHYLTIAILFLLAHICPLLYILSYTIIFFIKGTKFAINTLIPKVMSIVSPSSSTDLNSDPSLITENIPLLGQIEKFANLTILPQIAAYIDILLAVQLFFILLFDFRLLTFLSFVVYVLWLLAFEYSNNEAHARAWTSLSTSIRDFSAKNSETFGPKIDTVLDKFQDFGKVVSQWYPSRDVKIHLQ